MIPLWSAAARRRFYACQLTTQPHSISAAIPASLPLRASTKTLRHSERSPRSEESLFDPCVLPQSQIPLVGAQDSCAPCPHGLCAVRLSIPRLLCDESWFSFHRNQNNAVIPTGATRLFLSRGFCAPGRGAEESLFDPCILLPTPISLSVLLGLPFVGAAVCGRPLFSHRSHTQI